MHNFSSRPINEQSLGTYLASRVTLYLKMLCPVNAQIVPFTGSEHSPSNLPNLCTQTKQLIEKDYRQYYRDISEIF